jgi:enoyl-CoA hydratase/carnithine racemase
MSDITVVRDGHVAVLEINRPPANYFDRSLIIGLADASAELVDDGVRALVLASEGKHFCAGANFGGEEEGDRTARSIDLYQAAVRLFRIPVPVIAAVQGSAVGGGLGLACSADFRVASASSRFHANFVHLGFHPGFGLSESLPYHVGANAAHELLVSGRRITGDEAHRLGLVNRLVGDDEIRPAAVAWAHELASGAPLAAQSIKATLRGPLADRVAAVLNRELVEQTRLWQTEDFTLGIEANLARRTADFVGR